jgi:hypothetical protein
MLFYNDLFFSFELDTALFCVHFYAHQMRSTGLVCKNTTKERQFCKGALEKDAPAQEKLYHRDNLYVQYGLEKYQKSKHEQYPCRISDIFIVLFFIFNTDHKK